MNTLAVERVDFSYNGSKILKDIDFKVRPGRVLAVLGPNGVGKTTLLRCMNTILRPKSGAVMVEDRNILDMSPGQVARRLGYVAQRSEPARLTAFDAVLLGRKPHIRWKASEKDLRMTEAALRQLDLSHLALRPLDRMSGGELQKVCIARALVQEPKVLLLDEPTSSLDLKNRLDILRTISHVVEGHGMAAVMTMHNLNSALRFADDFLFMKNGRIHAACTADTVTPDMVAEVYGVPVDIERHRGYPVVLPLD